jgi:hypothetical protein
MDYTDIEQFKDRDIIGFVEPVKIIKSKSKEVVLNARIDTGATKCSIDEKLVNELKLGPIIGETTVRNAHGTEKRNIIEVKFQMANKTITEVFTIANREQMTFPVLIGRNVLRKGFLIDPNKKTQTIPKEQSLLEGFI